MKVGFSCRKINISVLLAAILVCAVCLVLFAGCDSFKDSSFKDEDYIEVQSLRFSGDNPTAEIKMSSSGEPSTYQLEVDVVPKNATNRALSYYISSEYHQYATVSSTGLITARQVTDGKQIPVVIRSTTNEKAVITASILVEDVAVSSIGFKQKNIELLYNGTGAQIGLTYSPSHAINGRNPTYTSQNEAIATVNSSGFVTPVGVGYTHILVACTTSSNTKIINQLEVHVAYAKGQYQLEVTGKPQFNQVIGDFTPIQFSLLLLGNNVDPNPKIQWYVGTEPVAAYNDRTQFTHTPDAQTAMSYRVRVKITPYQGDPVELESDLISVYQAFTGINLSYDNQSSEFDSYRYGDTATFELNAGDISGTITKYNWYLSDYMNPKEKVWIGETSPSDKNLVRRINVTGDYMMTTEAVNANDDLVSQRTFYFSTEKLMKGDTLVVRPNLMDYGLPPDSYHWYTVACDEDGAYDEDEKVWIKDTPSSEILYLPLTGTGRFRFIVTATIDKVQARVSRGGEWVPYEYVSDVIRVYDFTRDEKHLDDLIDPDNIEQKRFAPAYYSAVQSLTVEGIGRSETSVYLKWNNVEDVPSYQVEIVKENGEVLILDSGEKNDNVTFGSNFCYVSAELLTLSDIFSVRVKQKRGIYSVSFWYGTENDKGTADETHTLSYAEEVYPYFQTVGLNNVRTPYSSSNASIMNAPALNAYIADMAQLKEFLSFVLMCLPTSNTYITYTANVSKNNKIWNEYTMELYIPFAYTSEIEKKYPHGLTEEELEEYGAYSDYAKMVWGALNVDSNAYQCRISFRSGQINGAIVIVFDLSTDLDKLLKNTDTKRGTPSISANYEMNEEETVTLSDFPIDLQDSVYVYDSDELVRAVERGYRPVPSVDSTASLYRMIKEIAFRLVKDNMSSEEILLAFFDYIGLNTIYDPAIEEERGRATSKYNLYLFQQFRLEGVFLQEKAVDVGIAKAYAVMCGLYGIPCQTVTCIVNGEEHAFNKVYLNGTYYIVDIAFSMHVIDGYSVVSHDLFLIGEDEYLLRYSVEEEENILIYGDSPETGATMGREYTLIMTQDNLVAEVRKIAERGDGVYGVELTFLKSIYSDLNTVKDAIKEISIGGISISQNSVLFYSDNRELHIITLIKIGENE